MSDCHKLFEDYYKKISLTDAKKQNLRKARKQLRDKIRKYFEEKKGEKPPLFRGQGSFYMETIVNPLPGGEYDIDDGVYLQNLKENKSDWPSPETVHEWILQAIKGHTDKEPKDKRTCIRVLYSADYHVDLPIYGIENGVAYLAVKQEGWSESDPKSFIDWFEGRLEVHGEQLRRIICYLKTWADFKKGSMLSGVAFTVSASNNFTASVRDDKALVATARQMKSQLQRERSINKPVVPYENLVGDWTDQEIDDFIHKLDFLIQKGEEAIRSDDEEEASECWREVFGDRFPKGEPKMNPAQTASVLYSSSKTPAKPWLR